MNSGNQNLINTQIILFKNAIKTWAEALQKAIPPKIILKLKKR